MNTEQQRIKDYDLLTNFTRYNDPNLVDIIREGIPSTIFSYITNKYMSNDRSIDNEPALIYEVGKSCIHLHDYQRGIKILSMLRKFISTNEFIDEMISEANQMISDLLTQVINYENEVDKIPMDKFYYKWNGLQVLYYKEYRNHLINNEQISFLRYARQYLNRNDIFEQIFYLYAIETGRIEYIYDIDDTIVINIVRKINLNTLLEQDKNKTKDECEQIIKIINSQLKFISNNSKSLSLFTLDYFKQLHTEHVKYAPFTSHYVPELQAKIRLLIPSGEFKLVPNSPTRNDGKLFQFCPPSQVEEELKLLLSLLKQYQNEHVDPVVLAAWFHAEFIRIHPFVDGNGRIGRLLSSQILMKYGLLPMIVERKKRSEYIECMNESITQNNLTSLIHFIKREQLVLIEQVRKQTICEKPKYPLCQIDD